MVRQTSNFMIGLFVTIGIVLGIGVIVWVGASQYFEKGTLYVTYFDESVQGLQKDTMVKYRGVNIGRIVKIDVAPDKRMIEVVMKIDLSDHLEAHSVAQLRSVGLTGIVFIELDRRDAKTPEATPRIDFPTLYPLIPSRPSEVRQILAGIERAIDKLHKVDFQGISEQIRATAQSADKFFSGSRTERIMTNLEASTTALDKFMSGNRLERIMVNLEASSTTLDKSLSRLEKVMATGGLEGVLTEARQTLTNARSFVSGLSNELSDLKLADKADKANQVMDSLNQATRMSTIDIQMATENLRSISESLERLMERLENNPSDLLFSRPPEQRTRKY